MVEAKTGSRTSSFNAATSPKRGRGRPKGATSSYTMSRAAIAPKERTGVYTRPDHYGPDRIRQITILVSRVQAELPWLQPSDLPTLRSWAELEVLGRRAFKDLWENGLVNANGVPRRMVAEYTRLKNAQLQYERQLGMTPTSKANIEGGAPPQPPGRSIHQYLAEKNGA